MLSERLFIHFNAADAASYYTIAGEQRPYPSTTAEELQRVLARQADRLFTMTAHPSLDTVDTVQVSFTTTEQYSSLRCYDRSGGRDSQTRKPLDTRDYVVSKSPPPDVTFHGDIAFYLDAID